MTIKINYRPIDKGRVVEVIHRAKARDEKALQEILEGYWPIIKKTIIETAKREPMERYLGAVWEGVMAAVDGWKMNSLLNSKNVKQGAEYRDPFLSYMKLSIKRVLYREIRENRRSLYIRNLPKDMAVIGLECDHFVYSGYDKNALSTRKDREKEIATRIAMHEIDRMPLVQRHILKRVIRKHTSVAIAKSLGISHQSVLSWTTVAIRDLREKIKAMGIEL